MKAPGHGRLWVDELAVSGDVAKLARTPAVQRIASRNLSTLEGSPVVWARNTRGLRASAYGPDRVWLSTVVEEDREPSGTNYRAVRTAA